MRLAIMQPYLFPYIGYFQLMQAVDHFVVYDDVNFIKGGWINRNFILARDRAQRYTLGLRGASPNRLINCIEVGDERAKLLETLHHCYHNAPHYRAVRPLVEEVLQQRQDNLAAFLTYGLKRVAEYAGMELAWHDSSALRKDCALRGQDKILAICEMLGAREYINLSGGRALYSREAFARRGIRLAFIKSRPVAYAQFGAPFVANLSIIDVMMFNDRHACQRLLREYDLD